MAQLDVSPHRRVDSEMLAVDPSPYNVGRLFVPLPPPMSFRLLSRKGTLETDGRLALLHTGEQGTSQQICRPGSVAAAKARNDVRSKPKFRSTQGMFLACWISGCSVIMPAQGETVGEHVIRSGV